MSYLGLMSSPMPNKMLFKVSRISQSTVQVGEIRDSLRRKPIVRSNSFLNLGIF